MKYPTLGKMAIFHLAIPINDLAQAKNFYNEGLGCDIGRENIKAIIFNFYGTQLVAHTTQEPLVKQKGICPRHLGLILPTLSAWQAIANRAKAQKLSFYQQPTLRFAGKLMEHHTFFLEDPFYNLLEFKYYLNPEVIFGGRESDEIGDR